LRSRCNSKFQFRLATKPLQAAAAQIPPKQIDAIITQGEEAATNSYLDEAATRDLIDVELQKRSVATLFARRAVRRRRRRLVGRGRSREATSIWFGSFFIERAFLPNYQVDILRQCT
jgi:hypothetical protein